MKVETEAEYEAALAEYDRLSEGPADADTLAAMAEIEDAIAEYESRYPLSLGD